MQPDPILKELWEIKEGLSRECGHDLRRLFDKLQASEKLQPGPLVNRTAYRSDSRARPIEAVSRAEIRE